MYKFQRKKEKTIKQRNQRILYLWARANLFLKFFNQPKLALNYLL